MDHATGACLCYVVDPKASQLTIQAFASGLISAVAHSPRIAIRDWSGEVSFVPVSLAAATLRVKIKATSLQVLDELRDDDRREIQRVMNEEVLESMHFPEMTFQSTRIIVVKPNETSYRAQIEGDLTLHGVTNRLSFGAQVAFGIDSLRAHGDFALSQSDYGMHVVSIAGGTMKLRDELKVFFYLVARKQQ